MAERPEIPDLGTPASVVMDEEMPRTVDEDVKVEYRCVGPGYLDDIRIVWHWSFHVALYALQNPTPENIDRALELVAVDCDDWLDGETLRPLPVDAPDGWTARS
jgi:hypothetical protein